jgi:hypothetical protein
MHCNDRRHALIRALTVFAITTVILAVIYDEVC